MIAKTAVAPLVRQQIMGQTGHGNTNLLQASRDILRAEGVLGFTGTDNEFTGTLDLPGSGDFDMIVHAYQISTGNAGVYQRPLRIE